MGMSPMQQQQIRHQLRPGGLPLAPPPPHPQQQQQQRLMSLSMPQASPQQQFMSGASPLGPALSPASSHHSMHSPLMNNHQAQQQQQQPQMVCSQLKSPLGCLIQAFLSRFLLSKQIVVGISNECPIAISLSQWKRQGQKQQGKIQKN